MRHICVVMCLTGFMVCSANAQQIFGITYDISVPTDNTKSFIPNTSIIGFGLDARQMSHTDISYGVTFHWNSFNDNNVQPIQNGDGSFMSIEERSLESFPILVSSHYYFGDAVSSFRPLIGGNVGAYFIITRQYTGKGKIVNKGWHFGLAPDIGFMADFMNDIHILLTLRYNYAFKTSSSPAQSYFSVVIGFVSVSLF